MAKNCLISVILISLGFGLIIFAITTTSTIKVKNADPLQKLNDIQEEFGAKLKNFKHTMESEMRKMKVKIEMLEAKVKEQEDRLRDFGVPCEAKKCKNSIVSEHKKNVLDPKTCFEAYSNDPSLQSGMFWIDPDGQGRGDDPIYVYCDMTSGTTSILDDSEDTIDVGHCLEPGCYSREIKYNATLRQMIMLSELSEKCQQSIQLDCFDTALEFNGVPYAWWNDRYGVPRYFWSGINEKSTETYHSCQCGLDKNCQDSNLLCNCDSNLAIELWDEGVIADNELLPVTILNFGRTIASTSAIRYTLGRLECSGKVAFDGPPTSCQDLWRIGHILSGLYSIEGSSQQIEMVYCDFSKLPGDLGMQTWIGYSDVKSTHVYFNVQRNSSYSILNSVLPFDQEIINIGNAFNVSSGVFTAPRSGTYFFSFSSKSQSSTSESIWYDFQLNNETISMCNTSYYAGLQCNIPATLLLSSGDCVQLYLTKGSTSSAYFTGWFLSEGVPLS